MKPASGQPTVTEDSPAADQEVAGRDVKKPASKAKPTDDVVLKPSTPEVLSYGDAAKKERVAAGEADAKEQQQENKFAHGRNAYDARAMNPFAASPHPQSRVTMVVGQKEFKAPDEKIEWLAFHGFQRPLRSGELDKDTEQYLATDKANRERLYEAGALSQELYDKLNAMGYTASETP